MKEATGMCAMSSVIMSTWVITLSTLSRYLPKDVVAHIYLLMKSRFIYHLPAMITIVQVLGTFIPWLPGTERKPVSAISSLIRTCIVAVKRATLKVPFRVIPLTL